jgi:DNA integrity scanning protein DisA with diadenylate cyclase activity
MQWLSDIISFIAQEWHFFSWRDAVEILFFSTVAYTVIQWLGQDEQKNLVGPFYSYFALTVITYFLGLGSIFIALLLSLPVGSMLFILLHQRTLQKNYVTLKTLTPKIEATDQWLEELIQASLRGINKNKTVICIIERQQSLSTFFSARCTFNAPITKELLNLLLSASDSEETAITLWATQAGTLIAINPLWLTPYDELWVSDELKVLHKRRQDALLITQKSDAIATILSPESRLFDVLSEGKSFDNISAGYAFSLTKQMILSKTAIKGALYAPFTKSRSFKQPNA